MAIKRKEETRWCQHCTQERTVHWLVSNDEEVTPYSEHCPVCGVILMGILKGATHPVDWPTLVVWDEEEHEKINVERNTG
jgi:hypothetical protein